MMLPLVDASDDIKEVTMELNSEAPLPYHWQQYLNISTGELYYINLKSDERTTKDPQNAGYEEWYCSSKDDNSDDADSEGEGAIDKNKENLKPCHEIDVFVEVDYVPKKADLEDTLLEEFKKVLEKFSFNNSTAGAEDDGKKDELVINAEAKKKDSDSEEEPNDQHKEKWGS